VLVSYFMIVLDNSIIFTGLPQLEQSMELSPAALSWVQNAYTLVFGGLLLLGARAGDLLGRRRVVGGALAEWLSWRAGFFINVPIAVALIALSLRYLPTARLTRRFGHARLIIIGLILVLAGMLWRTRLTPDTDYLLGFGVRCSSSGSDRAWVSGPPSAPAGASAPDPSTPGKVKFIIESVTLNNDIQMPILRFAVFQVGPTAESHRPERRDHAHQRPHPGGDDPARLRRSLAACVLLPDG